jgi:hypothetical protein
MTERLLLDSARPLVKLDTETLRHVLAHEDAVVGREVLWGVEAFDKPDKGLIIIEQVSLSLAELPPLLRRLGEADMNGPNGLQGLDGPDTAPRRDRDATLAALPTGEVTSDSEVRAGGVLLTCRRAVGDRTAPADCCLLNDRAAVPATVSRPSIIEGVGAPLGEHGEHGGR